MLACTVPEALLAWDNLGGWQIQDRHGNEKDMPHCQHAVRRLSIKKTEANIFIRIHLAIQTQFCSMFAPLSDLVLAKSPIE